MEQFDQAAMVNTARIVSVEGGALVERQTSAVLGDIKKLTAQIQAAVGTDATSLEEVSWWLIGRWWWRWWCVCVCVCVCVCRRE